MRLAPPQHRDYTYRVIVQAVGLPVSLDTFKQHIKRNPLITIEDDLLTLYLSAAVSYAEKLTRRDFIQRTYETKRDFFPAPPQNEGYYPYGSIPSGGRVISNINENVGYEIRKSPLVSIEEINYLDNQGNPGVIVDSTTYYNTFEEDYSEVLTLPGSNWPGDNSNTMSSITIQFIAGLVVDEAEFLAEYPNLYLAIMEHAASLWSNRGDCSESTCKSTLPASAKSLYLQCRIENL